jgi:hypothetical protein
MISPRTHEHRQAATRVGLHYVTWQVKGVKSGNHTQNTLPCIPFLTPSRSTNPEAVMALHPLGTRTHEWFVPSYGPLSVRVAIGLLFLPYTGMVLAFTMIGSMMAERIHWDRVGAIALIYFLALGIGAHALDAIGSKGVKPWGALLPRRPLMMLAASSIVIAYGIGLYYIVLYVPLLLFIAVPEGFFLLAYNLEWFEGRFHTDGWFAVSWGVLPVLAGYMIQTNRLSVAVLIVAIAMGLLSLVEIKASRPYKALKRHLATSEAGADREQRATMQQFELILKSLSLGVMLLGVGLISWRF